MPRVYLDADGAVRSASSHLVVAEAGTTPRLARMRAAQWAAAADALARHAAGEADDEDPPAPTPISAAPSYARTVVEVRAVLERTTAIDGRRLVDETAAQLASLTGHPAGRGIR